MTTIHYVGVRHHSPACARRVAHVLGRVKPKVILIEGPSDMNSRLDEMLLPHKLPVALFTFANEAGQTRSCWTPFCEYSPEWVAMTQGRELGADVRFMDLPGWHGAFTKTQNRYSDRSGELQKKWLTVGEKLGVDGWDALWDHMFEQPLDEEELGKRLQMFFAMLRADEDVGDRDLDREAFMMQWIGWARKTAETAGGDVLVVCGGYHAARFEIESIPDADSPPEIPGVSAEIRVGSYMVPYSFRRLDSFTGYQSGMPSPGFQQAVWEMGPEKAGDKYLEKSAKYLRDHKQHVSPADLIAASTMAEGLRRTRGHTVIGRSDLLDGIAAALVKDALEVPLPWTYRDVIRPRTDPLLVEVMHLFSGDAVGELAAGTPRPPLLIDAQEQLRNEGLAKEDELARESNKDLLVSRTPTPVDIDLTTERGRMRSRLLHRLKILDVPGFRRESGPDSATEGKFREKWTIWGDKDAIGALIEASMYGPTLEGAAAGKLEESLLQAKGRLGMLAAILKQSVFVGVTTLAMEALTLVADAVGTEPSLTDLGAAVGQLLGLWQYDELLGAGGAGQIKVILEAAFERGLWLTEGLQGTSSPADDGLVKAMVCLRDLTHADVDGLAVDRPRAIGVMSRKSRDRQAPPAVQGAALGFVWSLSDEERFTELADEASVALRRAARPETLGDFLAGLFQLAREQFTRVPTLTGVLDDILRNLPEGEFMEALPALRFAFTFFPPIEKESVAKQVVVGYGRGAHEVKTLLKLSVSPREITMAIRLEREVDAVIRRYGLLDQLPPSRDTGALAPRDDGDATSENDGAKEAT